jgi:microcystin-dependent protein
MADTETALLQLVDQENGNNDNTWGDIADENFQRIETAIAGSTNKAISGGAVTLTDDEVLPAILEFTGLLTSNATITVPTRTKSWLVVNNTTGNYTVTVKTAAGTGYVVPRGRPRQIFCNGANVLSVDGAGSVPIGTILHIGATALGYDDVDFLLANGALVSRTTYAVLYNKIGTNYGVGDGSTTFALPNTEERYLRGKGATNAVGTYLADELKTHTHTASSSSEGAHDHGDTDSGGSHNHDYTRYQEQLGMDGSQTGTAGIWRLSSTVSTSTDGSHTHNIPMSSAHSHTITVNSTGGTETRPATLVALGIVRYQ